MGEMGRVGENKYLENPDSNVRYGKKWGATYGRNGLRWAETQKKVRLVADEEFARAERWRTERKRETLALRGKAHSENSNALAKWLSEQPQVKSVSHPSLSSHPSHNRAKKYFRPGCFGAVLTFELKGKDAPRPPGPACRALLDEMTEKLIEKENIDYDELAQMTQAHLNRQLTRG